MERLNPVTSMPYDISVTPASQPVSIDTVQPEEPRTVSIDTGASNAQPISPETANTRAAKATAGLGMTTGKSFDEIYRTILDGKEDQFRTEAASSIDLKKATKKQQILGEVLKKTGPLSPEDHKFIMSEIDKLDQPTDPNTVIEETYANDYMGQMARSSETSPDNVLAEAAKSIPTEFERLTAAGSTLLTKREIALTMADNIHEVYKNQSWFGYILDVFKDFIPLYPDYKLRGFTETSRFSGLLGTNLDRQADDLLRLPTSEFVVKLKSILDKLKADNPGQALMFASYVVGKTTREQSLDDLFNVINVATAPGLPTLTKVGLRSVGLLADAKTAVKGLVKSAESQEVAKVAAAEGIGDLGEAAVQKVTNNLLAKYQGTSNPVREAISALPRYLRSDIKDIEANPGNLSREQVNRLTNKYQVMEDTFPALIGGISRIERIPAIVASEKAVRALKEFVVENTGMRNSILDMRNVTFLKEPVSNTYHVEMLVGKPGGELFMQKQVAQNYAKANGLLGFEAVPKQQGMGYYLRAVKPVPENSPVVREMLLTTKEAKSPESWANAFLGWLRTPEETLSTYQGMNRHTVAYTPSILQKYAQEQAKEIRDLAKWTFPLTSKKERWHDWERIVKLAREMPDKTTGDPGYFFKGPGELQDAYLRHIGRMPVQAEMDAYFAYKRVMEMDRMLREVSIVRNKSRVGAESHTLSVLDKDNKRVVAPSFDGVVRKELPGGEDAIAVMGNKLGSEKVYYADSAQFSKVRKALNEEVKSGKRKVVEIYDIEQRPLEGFGKIGNQAVRYVVTNTLETKPLSWLQLPRRGGGHWDLDYDHYLKQAKVVVEKIGNVIRHRYEGDVTAMPISLRAMGRDFGEKFDKIRQLIKEGKIDEAKAHSNSFMPIDWKEVYREFLPTVVNGVKTPPRFNLNEPFTMVPKGKSIGDTSSALEKRYTAADGKTTFYDGTKRGSLARVNQVEYAGSRDSVEMRTIANVGSKNNPVYKFEPAKFVDPIPSMDRALTRIINSTFMDDYKTFSVEHWLREAGAAGKGILKASLSEIYTSPFHHFNNPEFRAGAPKELISQFMQQRFQIQQLIGTPTVLDTMLHSLATTLTDTWYTKFGPKAVPFDPSWMLSKLSDPARFVRSITAHAKLGLFAIPQLLVQSQTFVTIAGVAGLGKAAQGSFGTLLHQWSRVNGSPAILARLDEYASKFGFKPGEWTEARNLLGKTGFDNVGGEYALLDDAFSPKIITNGGRQFLDAGMVFFKGAERNVRIAAWYTAYKEFRDKIPTGAITSLQTKEILNRADLLTVNMSRASNSTMHTGVLSIPTQFLTYQLRAAELMLGSRITGMEKARLLWAYSAMYGLPVGASAYGFPFGDMFRKAAIDHGYVVGDNFVESLIGEGIPSMIHALVTGKGDIQKGNFLNYGDRYGFQGLDYIRTLLRGDKSMWNAVGGAAWSTLSGTWEQADGFIAAMASGIRDDGKAFPLKIEDFVDVTKELSGPNTFARWIYALNTGRWLSKKENYLADVSAAAATYMSLTGLQPQEVTDLNLKSNMMVKQKEAEKEAFSHFVQEYRRGMNTASDQPELSAQYYTRAFTFLQAAGYPEARIADAIHMALRGRENLVDSRDYDFYLGKDIPAGKEQTRRDAYRRILQIKQKREEQ